MEKSSQKGTRNPKKRATPYERDVINVFEDRFGPQAVAAMSGCFVAFVALVNWTAIGAVVLGIIVAVAQYGLVRSFQLDAAKQRNRANHLEQGLRQYAQLAHPAGETARRYLNEQ